MGDDGKQKPVIYFRGKEKGLVCNATNYDVIADAYGDETDDWAGQPIELYPTKVPFKGQLTDAIRVRIPQAKPEPAPSRRQHLSRHRLPSKWMMRSRSDLQAGTSPSTACRLFLLTEENNAENLYRRCRQLSSGAAAADRTAALGGVALGPQERQVDQAALPCRRSRAAGQHG